MEGNGAVQKLDFATVAQKKKAAANIIRALEELDGFLLVGHRNPDEDCVASMVAFGLLAAKLNKTVYVRFNSKGQDQFGYLLRICTFNSIAVIGLDDPAPGPVAAVVALDTPKPSMLDAGPQALDAMGAGGLLRIEIDHHLMADTSYFGDPGYRLVGAASSASELVGYLALKMEKDAAFKRRWQVGEVLSRNVVLAILTGIIGDSKMGLYLKTRRERWFYELFSAHFDRLLAQKTRLGTGNFASKEEVFSALASLSSEQHDCYDRMMARKRMSESTAYVLLDAAEARAIREAYGDEIMTSVAKAVADALAEERGRLGLLAYPDHPEVSDFVQFRVRRSHAYRGVDLRAMLERFAIANGGGHPGAVGFRFPKAEVADFEPFALGIVGRIDELARESGA